MKLTFFSSSPPFDLEVLILLSFTNLLFGFVNSLSRMGPISADMATG